MKLFIIFLLVAMQPGCNRNSSPKPPSLGQQFKAFHAEYVPEKLSDWGNIHFSQPGYWEASPATAGEVQALVRTANQLDVPLRIRGRGHSMNGSSLPQSGDLLVRTQNLRHFELFDKRTVLVGAGVPMYALDSTLHPLGCRLPVSNDGDRMGPTVGGFISAGGIGVGATEHGAFWENVQEVSIVDGRGDLVVVNYKDPNFPWLFGSMGQLGIIVSAKLSMLCDPDVELRLGIRSDFPFEPNPKSAGKESVWFTLFVPEEDYPRAKKQLDELMLRYVATMEVFPTYTYHLKHISFVPPLIYPEDRGITAVGMWGRPEPETTPQQILAIESAFMELLRQNPGYRRYVQTEIVPANFNYRSYFGDSIYEQFLAKKRVFDPKMLFDRGVIFQP